MSIFDFLKRTPEPVVERSDAVAAFDDPVSNSGFSYNSPTDDRLSIVYGCVRIRSNTVAQLPLKIYEKAVKGKPEAVGHLYYDLISKRPNGFQTAFQFWQWVVRQLDLTGNAFVKRIRNGAGVTIELIPINADLVKVKIDAETGLPFYKVTFKGSETTYDHTQIIHFKGYSEDGVVGLSTIESFRSLFSGYGALEEAGADIAKNSAKPANLVSHPPSVKEAELRQLKDSWGEGFRGGNAGKTAWLPNTYEVKPVPNALSAADAQYIEQKKFSAQRIATDIFGIPLHMLGLTTAPTYASVEQMAIEFVQYVITPIVISIEQTLNATLLEGDPDYYVKFNVKSLLRGDNNTRINTYRFYIEHGIMTPNQVSDLEDLGVVIPADQGGDTYVRPLNIAPATPEVIAAPASGSNA